MKTHRTRFFCLIAALALTLTVAAFSAPIAHAASGVAAVQSEQTPKTEPAAAEGEASDSWAPVIAKTINFVVLIGLLVYFLRTPFVTHLQTRSDQIRKDLVDAATMRAEGETRLADVRKQLSALPAELADMKRQGQEQLAAERVRMKEATARERQQMLERTHREIDLQSRLARRSLFDHAAQLSMSLARTRVERDITPADQDRLVDRYASEVR